MLDEKKITEISYKTTQFLLNELDKSQAKGSPEDVISLASSIASTVIFNLLNTIKEDKSMKRVLSAMAMWSTYKNLYKTLELHGIEKGNFSVESRRVKNNE